MNKFELSPTPENIYKTFIADGFRRNEDVYRFVELILNSQSNYSIALNGYWGSGKTFFINHAHMIMATMNNIVDNDYKEWRSEIENKTPKDIRDKLIQTIALPIIYDAWGNDNDEDPMISIIFQIVSQLNIDTIEHSIKVDINAMLKQVIKAFTKVDANDFGLSAETTDFLAEIKSQKEKHKLIGEFLSKVMEERGNKLVIFIDELDRCKPDYAVKLLERIKHYFTNENIVFVFSVNLKELQHTISKFYGEKFAADRYLDRFFDIKIPLNSVDTKLVIDYCGIKLEGGLFSRVINRILALHPMETREVLKFINAIDSRQEKLTELRNRRFVEKYYYQESLLFINYFMLPLSYALNMYNLDEYNSFIKGSNPQPLIDLLRSDYFANDILSHVIINTNETLDINDNSKTHIDKNERIIEIYQMITSKSMLNQNTYYNLDDDRRHFNNMLKF